MTPTLPASVRLEVQDCLRKVTGEDQRIEEVRSVGGGSISPAARLDTDSGVSAFLKWGVTGSVPPDFFAEEARSLATMSESGTLRVPLVYGTSDSASGRGASSGNADHWILLEWLEPARATAAGWSSLGSGLAAMHARRQEEYGWPSDNFIGSLRQMNSPRGDWSEFWRDLRLEPQLRLARDDGLLDDQDVRRFERLFATLPEQLSPAADEDGGSLLHGDLWSGNVHMTKDDVPAVVDPACYHGHREVDLAMSELFGGFSASFYESYEEYWPLAPGYRPVRRAIYQLYYLLVHVNLFGAGYRARTRQALSVAGV